MAIWGVRARVRSQAQTAISGHLDIADGLTIAGLGVFGYYLASYLDFFALTRISAGLERLILFLYPSLVVLLVALRDRRRIGTRELQALVLGYAGIVCVFVSDSGRAPQGSAAWFGVLAVFASTITYSLYLVGAERVLAKVGSLLFTGVAMTCACVASLTVFFVSGHDLTHIPARAIYLCALMAAFSTVGPTWLLTEAMRRIGPGRAALCGMLGPVTTVGLEVLLLGETAGWSDLLGTALVLGSVWLLTRARTHQ
jgi:drug/metabolite transporter (DMT)-like permease